MLLLLYGEEPFLKARKLQEIKERYASVRKEKFYLRVFDCLLVRDANDILQEICGASLFQEKKLIVLENPFSAKEIRGKLVEYKDDLAKTSHILVFSEDGEIEKKDPLLLFMQTQGKIQECSPLGGKRLAVWVAQEFLRYGTKASLEVQNALMGAVGNDLWRLSREIQKLATYRKGASLQKLDVEELVESVVPPEIFSTIDAIASRNRKQALALLQNHERHGDSPFYILSMLSFQFRALLAVKEMADRHFSYDAIVKKTKLHPYVVKKTWEAAKNFSLGELKKGLRRVFDIELGLKTGALEQSSALSWFVLGK